MSTIPKFRVELVRDRDVEIKSTGNLVQDCASVLHSLLDRSPVEQFVCLYVDYENKIVGAETVSSGTMDHVEVSMRDLFRGAILAAVPRVVLGHNHPSGRCLPSSQDMNLTVTAMKAGHSVGIEVWDHIVVSPTGEHISVLDYSEKKILEDFKKLGFGSDDLMNRLKDMLTRNGGALPHPLPFLDPIDTMINPALKPRDSKIGTNLGDKLRPLLKK